MDWMDRAGLVPAGDVVLRFGVVAPAAGPEGWLLAMAAPLSAFNGDIVDALGTGAEPPAARRRLVQLWDVQSRCDFEHAVRWLVDEGHRRVYDPLWRAILKADRSAGRLPPSLRRLLHRHAPGMLARVSARGVDCDRLAVRLEVGAAEVRRTLGAASSWLHELEAALGVPPATLRSLVAWDAVRLVGLVRLAVDAGLADRDEFARFAGGLAHQVQEAYRSWAHLGAAFVAAGLIRNPAPARRRRLLEGVRQLHADPRSPYRRMLCR